MDWAFIWCCISAQRVAMCFCAGAKDWVVIDTSIGMMSTTSRGTRRLKSVNGAKTHRPMHKNSMQCTCVHVKQSKVFASKCSTANLTCSNEIFLTERDL